MATGDIFKQGSSLQKGEHARLSSVIGAISLADQVKSTLGPLGRDKILQSTGRELSVSVTNDGATILKNMVVSNPAAKLLVDMSKTQDEEVGDGTTSVCVLAGELLRSAEELLNSGIHPQTITAGWRLATQVAQKTLEAHSMDNGKDPDKFKEDLLNIARTTLSSKILHVDIDKFSNLAVEAVLRLKGSTNLESIHVLKKLGGSLTDSYLEEGFLLDKKIGTGQPKRIEKAKILVANTAMDTDKIKIFGARVRVDSIAKLAEMENVEKDKMKKKCQKIVDHGINCFINRQLIYNFPEEFFAQNKVMAIEHADFDGIERLALVLGAEVTSTFDNPESAKLGECDVIEEVMIGEDVLIRFGGCKAGEACTVVLRGSSQHLLDEAERSLHDALCVLSQTVGETRTTWGAGCMEMLMARDVETEANKIAGKQSNAMKAFAKALRALPATIADNAGLDSAEIVAQLDAAISSGSKTSGIDITTGTVGDVSKLKITESFKVKSSMLNYAAEAAEMLLRVDSIITCAPRERKKGPRGY